MALTTAQFQAWLESNSAIRCLLVEVIVNISGTETTLYLSNRNYNTGPSDSPANTSYQPIVQTSLSFNQSLPLDGTASLSYGDIAIDNTNGERDSWLDYTWANREINLYMGDVTAPRGDFTKIYSGYVQDIASSSRNTLNLSIRDVLQRLNTPVSATLVGGTDQNSGQLRPLVFGEVHNITPVLVDSANLIYMVHNGPIERIIEVRDNGVPITSYTAYLANGTFMLNKAPAGTITCSVQGERSAINRATGGVISHNYSPANLTWTRSGTTATITHTAHGLANGSTINITSSSATTTIPLGTYTITVVNANTYTITCLSPENLLTWSQNFENSSWSKNNTSVIPNSLLAPDGTITGDTISNTPNIGSYIGKGTPLLNSTTYNFSIYVLPITTNKLVAVEVNIGSGYLVPIFNLANLTISGGTPGTSSITIADNGWYRLSYTFTTIATGSPVFQVIYIGAYGSTTDSVSIGMWGANLRLTNTLPTYFPSLDTFTSRNSTATYFNSSGLLQTAAANIVRNDYDPKLVQATIGTDLVSNGNFSSGTTGWAFSAPWALNAAGYIDALGTGSVTSTTAVLVPGKIYRVTFTSASTNGINIVLGGYYYGFNPVVGTNTLTFVCGTGTTFGFQGGANANNIDNISVYECSTIPHGQLIEEARTNLIVNGNGIGASGTTISTGWNLDQAFGGIAPSSMSTITSTKGFSALSFTINGTTTANNRLLISPTAINISVTANSKYSFKYNAEVTSGSYTYGLQATFLWYDSLGALLSVSYGTANTGLSGWNSYYDIVTAPTLATTLRVRFDFINYSTIGSVINFTMQLSGVQLEPGNYPTSYIPTTAGAVTRAADIATSTAGTPSGVASIKSYANTVAELIQVITQKYGTTPLLPANLDLTTFNSFDLTNQAPVGIYLTANTNVISLCQDLAASLGAQFTSNKAGLVTLLKLDTPIAGTVSITDNDIIANSCSIEQKVPVQGAVKLGYCKNWTLQTQLLTGIPEAHKTMLGLEYLAATATDSATLSAYSQSAEPQQKNTYLISNSPTTYVLTEATRLLNLWKTPRYIYKLEGTAKFLTLNLGDMVSLTHYRFGLSGTKYGQVVSIAVNWDTGRVNLGILV